MKKALSLLLALVMCLSLCACGENDATNQDNTTTNNISDNLDTSNSTTDASGADEDPLAFLYGDWSDLDQGVSFGFHIKPEGKGTDPMGMEFDWSLEGDALAITGIGILHSSYKVVQANGTYYLIDGAHGFVRDDARDDIPLTQEVQLSLDNWKEFFVIEEIITEDRDVFGDLTGEGYVYTYLSIKDAYRYNADSAIAIRCSIKGETMDLCIESAETRAVLFIKRFNNGTGETQSDITIDDIEMIRIEGTINFFDGI